MKVSLNTTYVDILKGDLVGGLLLSQIVYWFEPDKNGRTKLRVKYKGEPCLAKNRTDWYDEIRITNRQYDRSIKKLVDLGIVKVINSMFNGKRTPFIFLNTNRLNELCNHEVTKCETPLTCTTPTNNKKNIYKEIKELGMKNDFKSDLDDIIGIYSLKIVEIVVNYLKSKGKKIYSMKYIVLNIKNYLKMTNKHDIIKNKQEIKTTENSNSVTKESFLEQFGVKTYEQLEPAMRMIFNRTFNRNVVIE